MERIWQPRPNIDTYSQRGVGQFGNTRLIGKDPWRLAGSPNGAGLGVSSRVDITGLATAGAITRTTTRLWLFNAADVKIDYAHAWLQYAASVTNPTRPVRGRWFVTLQQQLEYGKYRRLTAQVDVKNPKAQPFRLGNPSERMVIGKPVLLQIDYEAASAVAGEVVFWDAAESLNVTVNMV